MLVGSDAENERIECCENPSDFEEHNYAEIRSEHADNKPDTIYLEQERFS